MDTKKSKEESIIDIGQLIMWALLLGTGAILVVYRDGIRRHERTIAWILAILLVISRLWRGSGYAMDGQWDRIVPLQLCSISTYLALIYFLLGTRAKGLELYLFFFGFLGLTSFIDPDVDWANARLSYIVGFVFDHLVITLMPLYLVHVKRRTFRISDIRMPYLIMVILLLISWPINYLWDGANFFYLVDKPVYSDVFSASAFTPLWYDIFYLFAFQFAFLVFNTINLSIVHVVPQPEHSTT
jgi:hypothetical integral membrane protein (TIGR02206 family)